MKLNKKYLIVFVALLIALVSVASAASIDDTDSVSSDATTSAVVEKVQSSADTQVVTQQSKNNNEKEFYEVTDNTVTKEVNSGQTRNTTPTVWNLSNANFSNIITGNGLNSSVNDGDILNFVSDVTRTGSSYIIDKPVTILGNQYTLNLNTGLNYAKTSLNFVSGASNSNITGLNLLNTQVYVNTSSNITFDNIHAKVNNSGVGAGVGSFAIRDGSINVTVKNSNFETYTNGGYSTLVLTWAKNCTIENNTVYGTGNVGNLVYLNNYGGKVNANGIINNSGNIIKDNTITAVDPGIYCYALTITGANNSIINNTISNNRNYSVTTTWAGSYEETNPGDTHNVSYHGNKYINNTIDGRFSTGNYSIVEGNWINGVSTIVGHANVTNNTFLGPITINNNVRFHSNNAAGQTVKVILQDSCFKNNTIGILTISGEYETYDCGENNIASFYGDSEDYFIPCNGSCPNCQSSSNMNQNNQILKKYLKNIKSDNNVEIAEQYSLYSENDLIIYNNGTAVITLTNGLSEYYSNDNPYSPKIDESSVTVNDIIIYVNYSPSFTYTQFNNKGNINLRIVWNRTGSEHQLLFPSGFKSVTCENYVIDMHNAGDSELYDDVILLYGDNLTLKNATVTYYPTSRIVNTLALENYELTEYGNKIRIASILNGAAVFVRGQNILIEDCSFDIETFQNKWNKKHTKCYPDYGVFIFESNNVTFSNNVINVQSYEKDLSIDVLSEYGSAIYGNESINDVNFINNEINVRFIPHINLTTNNSLFENNTITVQHADNTIELTGDNNIVRYNTLTAGENEGDATVTVTGENNIVEQNPRDEGPKIIDYYVSDADGSDENDGSEGSPFKTIQTAIDNTDDVNTFNIHILEGIYKGVGNTNLTVPGTSNINFIGAGINKTFIDGEANFTIGGTGSVWGGSGFWNTWYNTSGNWVMNISAGEGVININDLTIQNSWASSGSSITATSPTIDNHATLNVSNVYFYSNHAGNGAGIRNNYDGTLYVDNCVFENNTKSSTTGNYGAAVYNNGTAVITNSQIVRNFARWGSVTNDKNITLINCTFEGNGAYDGGSGYKNGPSFAADTGITNYYQMYGVFNLSSTIINCTFNDNQQCDISNGRGDLVVDNCVFNHSTGIYLFPNTNRLNTYIPTQSITNNKFIDMQPSTVFTTTLSSTTPSVAVRSLSAYPVLIENNEIDVPDVDYGYGLYLTSNATVNNNTLNNYIYVANKENTITNNVIITGKENTISLANAAANVTITDNTLYGGYTSGDLSVGNVLATTTLENNKPETNTYEINDDNYATYFDENSVLKTDVICNGSKITFVNNLTNKNFIFDNVKVAVDVNTTLINTTIVTKNNAQVLFNNLKISNDKTDEEYVILLDSENNIIKNANINVTTDKPVHVIKIEEDGNIITGTTINATMSAANVVWNNDYTIGTAPSAAVFIRSSNNLLNNTKVYVYATTAVAGASYPTVDGVDIQSKEVGEYVSGNEIRSSRINVTGGSYVYGLNIARAKETVTYLSYYDVTSSNYATAIQIGDAYNSTLPGYIYAKAEDAAYGYYATSMSGKTDNTNLSKLYIQEIRAPNAIGIALEAAKNVELSSATYNIYGENVTGISIASDNMGSNSENISIYSLTINLNGESNTSSMININDAVDVNITKNTVKSTSGNGINLHNTINSSVTNNYINVADLVGGDNAVTSNVENTIFNNTPIIAVLTDETYSDFFDENNTLKVDVGVISLGGDLHDKILIFDNHTQVINITNIEDYTMYNSTIVIAGNGTYGDRFGFTVDGINFNNTDKPVFIDRFNGTGQKNVKFVNSNIYVTGDDIVAFDAFNNESYIYLDISKTNIEMDGRNVTAINYAGYNRGQPAYIKDNNITLKATDKAVAFNAENAAIQFNNNIVEINAHNVVVANLMNSSISYYNFDENIIKVNATDAVVLNMTKGDTYTAYITDNEIYVTAENPSTLIDITGTRTVYVQGNEIILNATNGETPVISMNNPSSYVRNNFIMSNDLYGPEAVNATSQSDNTPIRTTIELSAPEEAKVFDEITITATVANVTDISDGIIILSINDEEVSNQTGNTITYTFTPTTNETLNIKVEFINQTSEFASSINETVITVGKLNTSLTLEVNRPFLDEDLIISGLLTNENGVMADTELNLTINGNTVAVTTDSEGKYNYTTTPIEGNNTVSVSFDGGNSYYSSEESTTTFVVDLEKYALVDELNDTVNEQAGIISDLNDTVQAQDKAIEELEQNLTDANSKIDSLNNNITKLNGQVSDLTNENKQLKDNLTKANDKIATQDKTISDLNKSLADANKALADADKQIKDLNSTIAKLNDQIKNLTTPLDTKVTINSITAVKYSDDVKITGKLTDKAGNAIKNTAVTLNINGKATNVATDAKGVYTYTGKATKVGTNNVTVQYVASDKYKASKATSTFKVNKQNLKITINNITSDAYKEDVTITGVFTDATGKGISNTNINLTINGKTVKVKTTTGGVFTYTTKATKVGTNNVTVSYAGNANYNKVTQKSTFKVVKQDLIVTIDTLDDTRFKENITISGRFVDGNAKPIGNTRLVLSINGKNYAVVTNAQGVYKRSIRVTQIDTNNVTVTYAGNANYNKCTAKATFKAIKQNLDITLDSVKTANGKVTVTGTFRDEEGKPLMNSNVKVTINGKTYSAKTNNKGIYTLTKAYSGSKITLTLGYPGNKNYNAFNKTTVLTL